MLIRKSVRKLKEFTGEAIPRLQAFEISGDLAQVRDLVVIRYKSIDQQLADHIAQARTESVEAEEAGDALDAATGEAIDSYDTVYKGLRIGHLKKQVGGTATADSHMTNLNRFLEGNNPSDFASARVTAQIGYLERAFQFRAQFLDGMIDDALIDHAGQVLVELRSAHEAWLTEVQEADEARAELDAVEEQARISYRVGRDWMRGCLTALGREDTLARFISPLRDIYRTIPQPANEDVEDADEPTPTPA